MEAIGLHHVVPTRRVNLEVRPDVCYHLNVQAS